MANNNEGLDKTSSRVLAETDELLQAAIDKASDARNAGSGRSRGFASLIVLVAGLLFQSGGILALGKLTPSEPDPPSSNELRESGFSRNERRLVSMNLKRISDSAGEILRIKNRIAPSMPIDGNIATISSAAADLEAVLVPVEESTTKEDVGN